MYIIIFLLAIFAVALFHIRLDAYFKHQLSHAGWHRPRHYLIFVTIHLVLFAIGLFWTLSLFEGLIPSQKMSFWTYFRLLLPFLIGLFLPILMIFYYKKMYQMQLRKESTYVVNFIIIYLGAGFTVDQTLERLLLVLRKHKFLFAKELQLVWYDLRYLGNRELAWQNMLDRLGHPDWLFFIRLLQNEVLYDKHLIDSFVRDTDRLDQMRMATVEFSMRRAGNFAIIIAWLFLLPALFFMMIAPFVYGIVT